MCGINAALFGFFPDLEFDYATIGLDGPAAGVPGANDPSLVQDMATPFVADISLPGTGIDVNTLTGASWYVLNRRPMPCQRTVDG